MMGTFKEDYDKRLRRVCGVSDDSLKVVEDSETVYGGYCETCWYEDEFVTVTVYAEDGSELAKESFYYMEDLIAALDQVEL
jgi:hypothetical protein